MIPMLYCICKLHTHTHTLRVVFLFLLFVNLYNTHFLFLLWSAHQRNGMLRAVRLLRHHPSSCHQLLLALRREVTSRTCFILRVLSQPSQPPIPLRPFYIENNYESFMASSYHVDAPPRYDDHVGTIQSVAGPSRPLQGSRCTYVVYPETI